MRKREKEEKPSGTTSGKASGSFRDLPGLRCFGVSKTPDFLKRKFCQIVMRHPPRFLRYGVKNKPHVYIYIYTYTLSATRNAVTISLPFLLGAGNGKETVMKTVKKRTRKW